MVKLNKKISKKGRPKWSDFKTKEEFDNYMINGKKPQAYIDRITKKNKTLKKKSNKKKKRLTYKEQLETPQWKEKRKHILETKGYVCAACGATIGLEVHHAKYYNGQMAWETPDDDLVVLCHECHQKIHLGEEI